MQAPNDIDGMILEARLDGADTLFQAAVWAYRRTVVDELCRFVGEFVPGAATIVLTGDTDWPWMVEEILDGDDKPIAYDYDEAGEVTTVADLLSDVFTSRLSELPDWGPKARVDVRSRVFTMDRTGATFGPSTDPYA